MLMLVVFWRITMNPYALKHFLSHWIFIKIFQSLNQIVSHLPKTKQSTLLSNEAEDPKRGKIAPKGSQ